MIQQVIAENSLTVPVVKNSTVDLHVEAEMILNSESRIKLGTFRTIFYSNNTSEIQLELATSLLTAAAVAGNLCSLRLAQYGDMRSFISNKAPANSFGSSSDLVQYFDCIWGNSTAVSGRQLQGVAGTFTLSLFSNFDEQNLRRAAGKGIILKNLSTEKTLSFGIVVERFTKSAQTTIVTADVTALC